MPGAMKRVLRDLTGAMLPLSVRELEREIDDRLRKIPALLNEYRSVLLRPKLVKLHGLAEAEVDRLLVELTANAIWREPDSASPAPERGDDHLWALLGAYSGSILITGDRLLLENPPVRSSVMSPKSCVDSFLESENSAG